MKGDPRECVSEKERRSRRVKMVHGARANRVSTMNRLGQVTETILSWSPLLGIIIIIISRGSALLLSCYYGRIGHYHYCLTRRFFF